MSCDLSVLMIIGERFDDIERLYYSYKEALQESGRSYEFICVLDGQRPRVRGYLDSLGDAGEELKIVELAKWHGESAAFSVALQHCEADHILTLPAYEQIDSAAIPGLLAAHSTADIVVAVRNRSRDTSWNRFQAASFKFVLGVFSGSKIRDLGCGVRLYKKRVFDDIAVYGDLHRFVPLLANKAGYSVVEQEVPQSQGDQRTRIYAPGIYVRRLLDVLTVFFLVKFTKKPLRFFGLIGVGMATLGGIALTYLIVERSFFGVALGDRPALLLSTLLFVVGIQLVAVGLIGELIIFTHASDIKEYSIDKIIDSTSKNRNKSD